MAYQDALFQLGMDLTRSSTAQKEDHDETPRVARDVVSKSGNLPRQGSEVGRFQDRLGSGFAGSHLIIDMFGARRLDDAGHIERTLRRCAELAGAVVVHVHLDAGTPSEGVSGFAVVGGGHLSIHTHPETGSAALDVYVRGAIASAPVVSVLEKAFSASRVVVREHTRGDEQQAQANALARAPQRSRTKVRRAA
jgi:S-adenosylmethionine decarboxylase